MNFPIYLVKVILCIKTITRLSFQKPFLESISFSFQINSLFILKSFHFFHNTSLMMNIREEKTNMQISFYPFCQRKGEWMEIQQMKISIVVTSALIKQWHTRILYACLFLTFWHSMNLQFLFIVLVLEEYQWRDCDGVGSFILLLSEIQKRSVKNYWRIAIQFLKWYFPKCFMKPITLRGSCRIRINFTETSRMKK